MDRQLMEDYEWLADEMQESAEFAEIVGDKEIFELLAAAATKLRELISNNEKGEANENVKHSS